jgi:hypothetical protein
MLLKNEPVLQLAIASCSTFYISRRKKMDEMLNRFFQMLADSDVPTGPLGEPLAEVGPYGPRWLLTPRSAYPRYAMRYTWDGINKCYGYELWRQDSPQETPELVDIVYGFEKEYEARDAAELQALLLMPDELIYDEEP